MKHYLAVFIPIDPEAAWPAYYRLTAEGDEPVADLARHVAAELARRAGLPDGNHFAIALLHESAALDLLAQWMAGVRTRPAQGGAVEITFADTLRA